MFVKGSKIAKRLLKINRCFYLYLKNGYGIALPYNHIDNYIMEEYIGMIKLFAGTFIPNGWAECNGQLVRIHSSEKLFSIISTTYGGDGMNNFALPDLRGRIPVGLGAQPGGETYSLGKAGGKETFAINPKQLPKHNHAAKISMSSADGDAGAPDAESVFGKPNYPDGRGRANSNLYNKATTDVVNTKMIVLDPSGEDTPETIDVRQPFIGMRYIICMEGLYPPRS